MVKGWQVLPDSKFSYRACILSFPRCGNGLLKPLDSGLRRNDGRGWGWDFFENGKETVGMVTNAF